MSADAADVLSADTTDVLSADTTDVLSADTLASVGGTRPEMVLGHNLQHMAPFGMLTIAFCMVFQGATLIFSAPGTRFGARTQPGNSPSRICQIWDLKNGIWSPFGHIGRTPSEIRSSRTAFPARTLMWASPGPGKKSNLKINLMGPLGPGAQGGQGVP